MEERRVRKHTLEGPDLLPSGKTFRVKHIHRFRLRDGKIVEHIAVRDDLGMFQQLGHLGALAGQPYSLEMLD